MATISVFKFKNDVEAPQAFEDAFANDSYDVGSWEDYEQCSIPTPTNTGLFTDAENEYLSYWEEIWSQHPLNRGIASWVSPPVGRHALKFDWPDFVGIHDCVHRLIARGDQRLPSVPPRRNGIMKKVKSKHGEIHEVEDKYSTFYTSERQDQHALYLENFSVVGYDSRSHFRFTFGNMEAALRITKHLWQDKLTFSNWRENFMFKIVPACFNFLSLMQTELNGLRQEQQLQFQEQFAEENEEFVPIETSESLENIDSIIEVDFYCHECNDTVTIMDTRRMVDHYASVYCEYEHCEGCDLVHACPNCSDAHKEVGFATKVDFVLVEDQVSEEPQLMEICTLVPNIVEIPKPSDTWNLDDFSPMEIDDSENDEWVETLKPVKIQNKDVPLNRHVEIVQEMLRVADPYNLVCKCYECVRLFVRKCKICPLSQFSLASHSFVMDNFEEQDDDPIYAQSKEEGLEETSEVSTSGNITFVDERPVMTDDSHYRGDTTVADPHQDISETPWSLNSILTREIIVWTGDWKENFELHEFGLPQALFSSKWSAKIPENNMIAQQTRFFGFWRAGIKVRVQLNGTKFHCGRLILFYLPPSWKSDASMYTANKHNWTNFPHQFLDASVSNSAILEIPYTHLLSHFPVDKRDLRDPSICTLGRVILAEYNPLRFATGAPSTLGYCVYMSLINPQLHQPRSLIELTDFSFGSGVFAQSDEGGQKQSWLTNAFIGGLSAGAARLTGGLVTGGLRVLAGMMFDKPTAPMPALAVVNKAINSPCHGAGLDESTRLSLCPVALTETPPSMMGGTDPDFNILTLCKMPSLLGSATWSGDLEYGATIHAFPVTPTWVSDTQIVDGSHVLYEPPMVAYVSRAFCYWRGSLKYKFQVVSTQFHSGRLAIIYDPFWTSKSDIKKPESMVINANLNWVVMDIQEKKEIEIEIPFTSIRPWLRCDTFTGDMNLRASKDIGMFMGETHIGALHLRVLNELVNPNNVASSIDVNVFVTAGDSFELAVPNTLGSVFIRTPEKLSGSGWMEYPWVVGATDKVNFVNKDFIDSVYLQGRRLAQLGKLTLADSWFLCSSKTEGTWGGDESALMWDFDKNQLQGYIREDPTGAQSTYMKSMPNYKQDIYTQSKEEQLTDRNGMPSVTPTKGHRINTRVAAETLSENAMNLSTVLKRAYPLFVMPAMVRTGKFTMITIPVTPTLVVPLLSPIRGMFGKIEPMTHLSWFSALYTYWRGSLRYKFLMSVPTDSFVWHAPCECREFKIYDGIREIDIQRYMSFAGTMAQTNVQSSIEVEVPFYSPYNQCLTDVHQTHADLKAINGTLFFAFRNKISGDLEDITISCFLGAGEDFVLNLMRGAPIVYEYQMLFGSCKESPGKDEWIRAPEHNKDRGDSSQRFALPGDTGINWLNSKGNISKCSPNWDSPPKKDKNKIYAQALEDWILSTETKSMLQSSLISLNSTTQMAQDTLIGISNVAHDTAEKVKAKLTPRVPGVNKYVDISVNIMMVYLTVVDAKNFLDEPSTVKLLRLALSFSSFLGYNFSDTLKTLLHSVADWVISSVLPRAQALDGAVADAIESVEDTIVPAVAVIGTLLYAYIFDCLPSLDFIKKSIQEFFGSDAVEAQGKESAVGGLRNFHFATLGMKAVGNVYDKMCALLKQFLDWLLERENPSIIAERKAGIYKDRLMNLIKEIDELDYEPTFLEALSDPLVHNRFYHMMDEANELMEIAIHEKLDHRVVLLIKETRTRARKLVQKIEITNSTANVRYDPFIVFVEGGTGTCKTEIMTEIAYAIAEEMGLPKYNLIFPKTTTGDGFCARNKNQQVWTWDEVHQKIENDSEEVGEIIEMRGNSPRQMNMPGCDEKGMQFNAKAVVLSGNDAYIQTNKVVRCREAYLRKRHMVIGAQHRPGWDVMRLQNSDEFDPEFGHIVYAVKSSTENEVEIPGLDKNAMLAEIKRRVKIWDVKQKKILAHYTENKFNQVMPRGVMAISRPPSPAHTVISGFDLFSDASSDVSDDWIAGIDDPRNDIVYEDAELSEESEYDERYDELFAQGCACQVRPRFVRSPPDAIRPPLSDFEYMEREFFLERSAEFSCCEANSIIAKVKRKASNLFKMANSVFKQLKTSVLDFFTNNPRLAQVLGVLTLFATSGALFWKLSDKPVAEGVGYSNDVKTVAKTKVVAEGVYETEQNTIPKPRVLAEGSEDPQGQNIATIVHPYVVPVRWEQGAKTSSLSCFHLGGSIILTTFHFFNHAKPGDIFALNHRVNPVLIEYDPNKLVRLDDRDWCIYDCGPRLEPRKRMIKFFVSENQLAKVNKLPALFLGHNGSVHIQQSGTVSAIRTFEYSDSKYGDVFKQSGWKGNFMTSDGDCGALVVGLSNQLAPPGKILGIHVAGRTSKAESYTVLITREKLQSAWDLLTNKNVQVEGLPIVTAMAKDRPLSDCKIIPQGDYSLYGVMPNKLCPAQPQKTAYIKTPFYGEAEKLRKCVKKPAKLFPFQLGDVKISPLKLALEKYGCMTIPFPSRQLNKIYSFVRDWTLEAVTDHQGKRIFSETEAIMGIPGISELQRMNMKSSPGWPYQVENKGQSGKWYLFDDDLNIIDKDLRKRVDTRIELAKEGQRIESLWRDCLKDELRPIEKVDQGKTRLFTIAPVDYTIVVRRYFMDFCAAFYSSYNKDYFSAVGINPESLDWTDFYNYLSEFGDQAIAGDFKMFDGKAMPELIAMFIDIVNEWYDDGPENALIRKVLGNEMIHTMQLCENTVYATHQGNPSGNPLTVIVNCFINLFYILYTWIVLMPEKTLDDFRRNVRTKKYGDDNAMIVKPGNENFNQGNISKVLAAHGIDYTDDTKLTSGGTYRPLDQITFLKRGFRRDVEFGKLFVLPTMSVDTLNSFMFYVRNQADLHDQLRENMRAGLNFAAFHGRKFYEQYHKEWNQLMRSVQYTPLSIAFDEQVDIFRHMCGMQRMHSQEAIETFMSLSNHKLSRAILGIVESPLYYLCASLGILSAENSSITRNDDRLAVAIPSGEGKSFLCNKFPHVFVDHDKLLIPKLKISKFVKSGNPWRAEEARKYDFPKEDRRILLVHHPDNTHRCLVGSFITHFPTFVRVNAFQRLLLKNPLKMTRDNRNALLVEIARKLEPDLFQGV